jgi:transcriptional regulator with GAF, ATPase, and Fis domain
VESELFGHERGAFTGAVTRKIGKVELAEAGTLFLDEIGDLSPAAQAKLLKVLEERTFERVGGTQSRKAQVRVIAATNRDLRRMVDKGTFREDLYFRLRHFQVELPPLRQRRADIPMLASFFAARMAAHLHKEIRCFESAALALLQSHEWPGNVRELEHAVRRSVVVCTGEVITADDLALDQSSRPPADMHLTLQEQERRYILQVLEQTGWLIKGPGGAAEILGLPASTLYSRMKKLGIHRPS